jgi:hypothetical protein
MTYKYPQPNLIDSLSGKWKPPPPPTPEEQKNILKQQLINKAKAHCREFLKTYLQSIDSDSIELRKVVDFIRETCREMEGGIFYTVTLDSGKVIIKKYLSAT